MADQYCADIVVGYNGIPATDLKEYWMPEDPNFNTIPADFLNTSSALRQICIPANIKNIKTRAFAGTGTRINYIWTTGSDPNKIYDNGATFATVTGEGENQNVTRTLKYKVGYNTEGTDETLEMFGASDDNNFTYGTFTLPAGLELIERFAFYSSTSVSDVYVLNTTAPECHVDAFNSSMYHANNTVQSSSIIEEDGMKIITREAYNNGIDKPMTVLHYPRETTTPNIQRYTDPTREYSIATGERDGNGNMLYFPTHTEFEVAYWQATYGYLWNAWNIDRTWYNQEIMLGTGKAWYGSDFGSSGGHDISGGQALANQFYEDNTNTEVDKTDRSYYDVRINETNQPALSQPTDLDWYYNTIWEGSTLYPEMVYTNTETVIGQQQSRDPEGHLVFQQGDCDYVQDYSYIQQEDGEYVWEITITENPNGNKVKDYYYEQVADGEYYHPLVSRNYDASKPKPWYSKAQQQVADPDGDYIWTNTIGDQYNYTDCSTWLTWGHTEDDLAEKRATGWTFSMKEIWTEDEYNGTHYVSEGYATYSDEVTDYVAGINGTRYNKVYSDQYRDYNASTDAGENRYDVVDNGMRAYNGEDDDAAGFVRYHKQYKDYTYRLFDSAKDEANETRYCPVMEDVYAIERGKQNDYRGWHQFVLTGYSYNDIVPMEPLRFFINDNDWWTICEPYDLTYNEMIKFFGADRQGFAKQIPYLSKLMYVVRDVEKNKITLVFSKNLMEYKEQFLTANGTNTTERVHGIVDDETKWTAEELADDPIILHAGVPYLIRPNMYMEDGKAVRQFDIFKNDNPELYARLSAASELSAGKQADLIYNGEYTVPAYVVGYDADNASAEDLDADGELVVTMKDGTTITYQDSQKDENNKILYGGKQVSYRISDDYKYTFVGTFYKSLIPQYSYFLGWDSKNNCAAFWYSDTQDKTGWNWNNETGIIIPNFDTNTEIHQASSMDDPARWTLADDKGSQIKPDDFPSSQSAKSYSMEFGGSNLFDGGDADAIIAIEETREAVNPSTAIYSLSGSYLGTSSKGLAKGVYIRNGKKIVVK